MKSPVRLRDDASTSDRLRLALDALDDEPSEVELRSLAMGLGIGAVGSVPVQAGHVPHVETAALGSAVAKAATFGGSKVLALVAGPALAGALAGGALLTTTTALRTPSVKTVPVVVTAAASRPDVAPHRATVPIDEPPRMAASPPAPQLSTAAAPSVNAAPPPETTLAPPPRAAPIAPSLANAGESEIAYLERAKSLVPIDPERAFALADEHAALFPKGMLEQESEVIAIEALARGGRTIAASERLNRFRSRFPSSAYLPHVITVVRSSNSQ